MKGIIWAAIGIAAAVIGIYLAVKTISLKKKGSLVLGEVIEVREKTDRRGRIVSYIHRLRYEVDGKTYEKDDRAGFNLPFKVGEKHLIYVYPNDRTRFEYESQIKKNVILYIAMAVLAVVLAVKWILSAI